MPGAAGGRGGGNGLCGPNLFPEATYVSPNRAGVEGPLDESGQGEFDNMSDLGDDVTKGAKSSEMIRVYVHANPSEASDSQPVVLYEGSFQGTPGTIALACRTGKVTVEALLADRQMGAMHYKSHKADLLIPVRDCDDLRPIELEEGAPIKVWIERRVLGADEAFRDVEEDALNRSGGGDTWEDCGAWDGLLGVRERSFLSGPRTSKGRALFEVMWGLAFNREKCLHQLVYLCLRQLHHLAPEP